MLAVNDSSNHGFIYHPPKNFLSTSAIAAPRFQATRKPVDLEASLMSWISINMVIK